MNLMSIANRTVVVAVPDTSVQTAAQLMREHHVGALVIMSSDSDDALPIGMLTDRDLVVEVLAQDVDPDLVTVGDITMDRLVTAQMEDGIFEAVALMSQEGVRRLVVVDDQGAMQGVVSMDDVLVSLAQAMTMLAKTVPTEIHAERRERPTQGGL
jgi:signal-transduction protein with cAMP-binding, CBS, and nucleotidyltransferase domain